MEEKYIIDTDIGDDIDDAFALLLALRAELDLVGITTVFRNSLQRAKMTKRLLSLFGKPEIPVRAGVDTAITQRMEYLLPAEMLAKEESAGYYTLPQYLPEMEEEQIDEEHAVDFIIRQARTYPGQLVLIAIGPFSNAAMALRKAPDIAGKLKEIRIIGGYYTADVAEWNILCDPESAKIVFGAGVPVKAFGLDITMNCPLTDEDLAHYASMPAPCDKLVGRMMEKWFEHYRFERPVVHDAVMIADILDPGVVRYETKFVRIGVAGAERGKSIVESEKNAENAAVSVGLGLDPGRFFRLFRRYVFRQ